MQVSLGKSALGQILRNSVNQLDRLLYQRRFIPTVVVKVNYMQIAERIWCASLLPARIIGLIVWMLIIIGSIVWMLIIIGLIVWMLIIIGSIVWMLIIIGSIVWMLIIIGPIVWMLIIIGLIVWMLIIIGLIVWMLIILGLIVWMLIITLIYKISLFFSSRNEMS